MSLNIVVTPGPASWQEQIIVGFLDLGVRSFRFPFAKETPSVQVEWARFVRSLAAARGIPIAIIADLPGGKPRLNNETAIRVGTTQRFSIQTHRHSLRTDCDLALSPWLEPSEHAVGTAVIGDGENEFEVENGGDGWISGRFTRGGIVDQRRAFLPRAGAPAQCFTATDQAHARLAAKVFDTVMLSFVSGPDDVTTARTWLRDELHWEPALIAKVETPAALERVEPIAQVSNGVLVARGDLALQIGQAGLWAAQKTIIRACRSVGTPVTVGTGVLESMRSRPAPTRAECIDVAACVELGVQGFMFSTETSLGSYPLEIVQTLLEITRALPS